MAKVAIKKPFEELEIVELQGDVFGEIRKLCADESEDDYGIVEAVHLKSPWYSFSFFVNENGMGLNMPVNFIIKSNNPVYPVQNIYGTAVFTRGHIVDDDIVFDDITIEDIAYIQNLLRLSNEIKAAEENLIKVNLPFSDEEYRYGNGEGIWCKVSEEIKMKSDNDVEDGVIYSGTAENDSVFYPSIKCGSTILFRLRGEKRAVADMDFLADKQRISERELLLCKMIVATKNGNLQAAAAMSDVYVDKYGKINEEEYAGYFYKF